MGLRLMHVLMDLAKSQLDVVEFSGSTCLCGCKFVAVSLMSHVVAAMLAVLVLAARGCSYVVCVFQESGVRLLRRVSCLRRLL